MKLSNIKITNKGLYWGLIICFIVLYACVGFVSTLHSITFFQLANNLGLAVLLGLTYEIGQSAVLFSILMTKGKEKFLPWALMILLTALQVTANVYASFKFMIQGGSTDWIYWQKSILFGVQASSPEMYQVIISWIAGALLPVVALGMTALVAQNIKEISKENEAIPVIEPPVIPFNPEPRDTNINEIVETEVQKRMTEIPLETIVQKYNDLQKTINEYKEEINPKTEISEVIDDFPEIDELDEGVERLTPEIFEAGRVGLQTIPLSELEKPIIVNPSLGFEKDFIMPEVEKKKRGRPPKKQIVSAVVPKKEQKPLPNEKLKVPEKKRQRFVNPLIKKSKIEKINLKEITKPSKGDEVLKLIENMDKQKQKDSIILSDKNKEMISKSLLIPSEIFSNPVEVIDAEAVEKIKGKGKIDKFGIPIRSEERKNFDRI